MNSSGRLDEFYAAVRRERSPHADVVERVLARLPGQVPVIVADVEMSEWIGAGASTLVAACCLWLVMPLWNASWAATISGWHPLAAMLQQLQ